MLPGLYQRRVTTRCRLVETTVAEQLGTTRRIGHDQAPIGFELKFFSGPEIQTTNLQFDLQDRLIGWLDQPGHIAGCQS